MSVAAQLAQKTKISISSDGGTTYVQIKELKGITPSGAASSQIDVTDLDSDAKEYRTGLLDNGTIALDVNIKEDDPGQVIALAAFDAASSVHFKHETTLYERTFEGSMTKWPTIPNSIVDGVLVGSGEIRVSGAVTATVI